MRTSPFPSSPQRARHPRSYRNGLHPQPWLRARCTSRLWWREIDELEKLELHRKFCPHRGLLNRAPDGAQAFEASSFWPVNQYPCQSTCSGLSRKQGTPHRRRVLTSEIPAIAVLGTTAKASKFCSVTQNTRTTAPRSRFSAFAHEDSDDMPLATLATTLATITAPRRSNVQQWYRDVVQKTNQETRVKTIQQC